MLLLDTQRCFVELLLTYLLGGQSGFKVFNILFVASILFGFR